MSTEWEDAKKAIEYERSNQAFIWATAILELKFFFRDPHRTYPRFESSTDALDDALRLQSNIPNHI